MIVHTTAVEHLTAVKTTIATTYSYYTVHDYSATYIILLTLPFMQCEVQSGYSEHTCSFIHQRLLAPARKRAANVRQVCFATSCSSYLSYTDTQAVIACTVSSPHVIGKFVS